MADTDAPLTEESFMADRLSFWGSVTGATVKIAAGLIAFCAWLWWATFAGFGFLHVAVLPVVIGAIVVLL